MKKRTFAQPVQHSMSLIGNAPANNVGLLHVIAHASQLAGGSMTAARTGNEDRTTEVDNGRTIGRITLDIAFKPGDTVSGYYEYCLVKYQRQFTVPVWGTNPVPTTANVLTDGLQREARSLAPGYVLQYGLIPLSAETTHAKKITLSLSKFRKAQVRDGDYVCLLMFNRTGSTTTYDIHGRYRTWSSK